VSLVVNSSDIEAAVEKNSAIGLFIDEVQYLSTDELAAVIVGCHTELFASPAQEAWVAHRLPALRS
jgi:hypothetical protein